MGSMFQDIFYGRKPVVELLKKRYLGLKEGYRQNIALVGPRHIGKSVVLHKFLSDMDDKDVIHVYVDLEHKDANYFFAKFIGSILHNYSKVTGLPLHEDIALLLESTKSTIPETAKAIVKIQSDLLHHRLTDAYKGILALPEIFTAETGKFCVLVLDEFQNLEDYSLPNLYQDLSKKIMTQKKCLYILTSSYPEKARIILNEKLSLLFGNFEIITLECFDHKTSQEFIGIFLGEIKIGESLQNFLIDFTGGHPLYLTLILEELRHLTVVHRQSDIYTPLLAKAVENVIFSRWGVISRHFELMVEALSFGKGNKIVASILIALSNNRNKRRDLSKLLGVKQGLVSQKINRLIEDEVVAGNGQYLYLKDKLFRYWVKYVFQRKMKAIDLDSTKLYKEFIDEFNYAIAEFQVNAKKDLTSRIVELLYCFDSESIHINGRKYKLPVFNKIVPVKAREEKQYPFDVMKASTADGFWYILFKRGMMCESDISQFINDSKKQRMKPLKCIVISPSSLDDNARLKALQEKMWIWNENELSELTNFFDKPFIVR